MSKLLRLAFVTIIFCLISLGSFSHKVSAASYYVSLSGSDTNAGTQSAPFKTFSKAFSVLSAGDTMWISGGTYTERLEVKKSGTAGAMITIAAIPGQKVVLDGRMVSDTPVLVPATRSYISLRDLEVTQTLPPSGVITNNLECLLIRGNNIELDGITAHNCPKFGFRITGSHITVSNSVCRDSVTENLGGKNTTGGWGACMRTAPGSSYIEFKNNHIYNNWGEGLIIGQAVNVLVHDNLVHDNYSQNIYIGNTHDVEVYRNMTYSKDSVYYRSGLPANCISSSEENINSTWGAQLGNIKVYNNIAYKCKIGIGYTYTELANNGCNNCLFANNTLVQTGGIKIINGTKNNVTLANNLISGGSITVPDSGVTQQNNLLLTTGFLNNPDTNPNNYQLSASSTAINKGVALPETTEDYFRTPRDSSPDIGAVECSNGNLPASTFPSPSSMPGDSNGDNIVDGVDYTAWVLHYNTATTRGVTDGDFDRSGFVDGVDYTYWALSYH